MAISSINSNTTAASTTASSASTTAASTGTTTSISSSSSSQTSAAVAAATALASDSGVVATIGGGNTSGLGTYSAQGLLNAYATAGTTSQTTVVPTIGTDTSQVAQLSNDAAVVGTLNSSSNTAAAGTYSSSGTLQNLSASVTATYSDLLSSNPNLASTFVGASYSGGIISTIA